MAADRTALAVLASGATGYVLAVVSTTVERAAGDPSQSFAVWLIDVALAMSVFTVSLTVVGMIILVPVAAILRWLRFDRSWVFVLIYNALFLSPHLLPLVLSRNESFGYSTRDCDAVVKGVTTACGWVLELQGMAFTAVIATLAGLVFAYVYHRPVKRRGRVATEGQG